MNPTALSPVVPLVEPPRPADRAPAAPVISPEVAQALVTIAAESEHLCDGLGALTAAVETNTRASAALHEQIVNLMNGDRQALGRLDRLCGRLDRLLDHLEAPHG